MYTRTIPVMACVVEVVSLWDLDLSVFGPIHNILRQMCRESEAIRRESNEARIFRVK